MRTKLLFPHLKSQRIEQITIGPEQVIRCVAVQRRSALHPLPQLFAGPLALPPHPCRPPDQWSLRRSSSAGAPQVIQVAGRWHLIDNLAESVRKFLLHKQG